MLYFIATFAERMRHANGVCVGVTSNTDANLSQGEILAIAVL
ncbi:hypothetical protein [Chamaesiphon sp.]